MSGSWDVKTWGACLGASEKRPTWRVVANKPLYVSRLSSSDNSRFFTRFNYVFEAIGKIQKESLKMLFDANVNPEQIVSEPLYLRHCCLLVKIGNTKCIPDICHFFTPTHFEAWKFYTQKCVNSRQKWPRDKTEKITTAEQNYILCIKLHAVLHTQ